jgi:hypothetical protein
VSKFSTIWAQAWQELKKMPVEAKGRLEAEKFLTGTSTDEPQGLLTSLDAVGDPVLISSAFSCDHGYTVRGDLPSCYQPRARWLAIQRPSTQPDGSTSRGRMNKRS